MASSQNVKSLITASYSCAYVLAAIVRCKSEIAEPPIVTMLLEPREPQTCRIQQQQCANPDDVYRPKREPVVGREEFAPASHRGRRDKEE